MYRDRSEGGELGTNYPFFVNLGLVPLFTGMREQAVKIDCTNRNKGINQMKS